MHSVVTDSLADALCDHRLSGWRTLWSPTLELTHSVVNNSRADALCGQQLSSWRTLWSPTLGLTHSVVNELTWMEYNFTRCAIGATVELYNSVLKMLRSLLLNYTMLLKMFRSLLLNYTMLLKMFRSLLLNYPMQYWRCFVHYWWIIQCNNQKVTFITELRWNVR